MNYEANESIDVRLYRLEQENEAMKVTLTLITQWITQATGTLRVLAAEVDSPDIIIP